MSWGRKRHRHNGKNFYDHYICVVRIKLKCKYFELSFDYITREANEALVVNVRVVTSEGIVEVIKVNKQIGRRIQ